MADKFRVWWRPKSKAELQRTSQLPRNALMRRQFDGKTYYSMHKYDRYSAKGTYGESMDYGRSKANELRRKGHHARIEPVRRRRR